MNAPGRGSRAWLALAVVTMALDQLTKFCASEWLKYGEPLRIAPSLNFTLLHNPGAAFSFLADASGWQRWVFSILAIGISLYLVILLRAPTPASRSYRAGLAFILGGALGNLIDRIQLGYVVDFIQVYYEAWYFPAFNLADSAITLGAGLLLVSAFRASPGDDTARASDRCV